MPNYNLSADAADVDAAITDIQNLETNDHDWSGRNEYTNSFTVGATTDFWQATPNGFYDVAGLGFLSTMGGNKTAITWNWYRNNLSGVTFRGVGGNTTTGGVIDFDDGSLRYMTGVASGAALDDTVLEVNSDGSGITYLGDDVLHTGNTNAIPLTTNFAANTDNTYSNGTASNRWSIIYAGTGSINTSDGREKDNYRALTDAEMSCAKELSNNIGVYQWLSSLEEKGDDARLHVGMYVQHAISVFESFGLDPMRYGFICYDEWDAKHEDRKAVYEQTPVLDEDGNETGEYTQGALIKEAYTEEVQSAGNRYGFRYDQLNQFLIAGLNARIKTLEGK